MAKTKPIGVRFDENFLDQMRSDGVADTYQKAVNFLCQMYTDRKQKDEDELQEEIVFTPTPENGFDGAKLNITYDEPPKYAIVGVTIPEPENSKKEKIGYTQKIQPAVILVDASVKEKIKDTKELTFLEKLRNLKSGIK